MVKVPFKDDEKRRAYMRKYKREYRQKIAKERQELKILKKKVAETAPRKQVKKELPYPIKLDLKNNYRGTFTYDWRKKKGQKKRKKHSNSRG